MTWGEIEGRDWTVPAAATRVGPPPGAADRHGDRSARAEAKGFVFSSDGGRTPFSVSAKPRRALDAKLAEIRKRDGRKPMAPWVLHDLRRTAAALCRGLA